MLDKMGAWDSKAGRSGEDENVAEPLDEFLNLVKVETKTMLENLEAVVQKHRLSSKKTECYKDLEVLRNLVVDSHISLQKRLNDKLQLFPSFKKFQNSHSTSRTDVESVTEVPIKSSPSKTQPSRQGNPDLGCGTSKSKYEEPMDCAVAPIHGLKEPQQSPLKEDINSTLQAQKFLSQCSTDEYSSDEEVPDMFDGVPKPTVLQDLEPTVVEDETTDVESVDGVNCSKGTDVGSSSDALSPANSHQGKNGSDLNMKDLRIVLERLPAEVFDAVKDGQTIHLCCNENESSDEDNAVNKEDSDLFLKALRRLQSFNVKKMNAKLKSIKSENRSSTVSSKRQPARANKEVDEQELIRRLSDGSETDWSESETQVLPPRPSIVASTEESVPNLNEFQLKLDESTIESESCDSDYLEGTSSGEEEEARRAVLKGTTIKKEPGRTSESDTAEKKKKKERKSYYTPRICRIPSMSESDDDSIIAVSPAKSHGKRRAIVSDSSDDDKENKLIRKKLKRDVAIVELSSDSDSKTSSRSIKLSDVDPTDGKRNSKAATASLKLGSSAATPSTFGASKVLTQFSSRRPKMYSSSDSEVDDFKEFRKCNGASQATQIIKIEKTERKPSIPPESVKPSAVKADVITLDDSDEDESQNSTYRGRRNIRDILDRSALMRETQEAETNEELRRKRLARRQAEFNKVFKAPKSTNVEAADVVLDFDPVTKQPLVTIHPSLVKKLKPHQAEGVRFMWNNCFESVDQYKAQHNLGSGCILAHCMGLGKTFQTVAFVHTILTSEALNIKTVLIICPLSTLHNWHKEFQMWLKDCSEDVILHKFEFQGQPTEKRIQLLERWKKRGGVGIIPYTMFRNLVDDESQSKRIKRRILSDKERESIHACLLEPGADVVICDEGHILRNDSSKLSVAVNRMKTKRRVILTGTPLQNNLMEYHTMMNFVKPNLLGTRKEFANRFSNPITNGQHKDSTPSDVRIMKKRAHVLHKLLEDSVQRLDYSVLTPYLPPKLEYAIIIHMSDIQKKLYNGYLNLIGVTDSTDILNRIQGGFFFADFSWVSKIWSHPFNLTLPKIKDRKKKKTSASKINVEDPLEDDVSNELEDELVIPASLRPKERVAAEMEAFEKRHREWWLPYFEDPLSIKNMVHSSKCVILMEILETCAHIGDKVLVFSQYLYSLNLIEDFLQAVNEESRERIMNGADPDEVPRWKKGIDYFRLDGSVKSADRQKDCDSFNRKDSTAKLFLISTRAGGLGINLVGANRVVLFDASFNPANDMQGIFRVFRFGQTKPCYIYRLISKGTMEEKVYNRQVVKLSLSGRVVDEQQIQRHFTMDELAKMYLPIEDEEGPAPSYDVPKDRLLSDLLLSRKSMISTYLEHDSLLQNQLDEKLTDEERQAAWDEYENEKKGKKLLEGFEFQAPNIELGPSPAPAVGTQLSPISAKQGYSWVRNKLMERLSDWNDAELDQCVQKVSKEIDLLNRYKSSLLDNTTPQDLRPLRERQAEVLSNRISSYMSNPINLRNEIQKSLLIPHSATPAMLRHTPQVPTAERWVPRSTSMTSPAAASAFPSDLLSVTGSNRQPYSFAGNLPSKASSRMSLAPTPASPTMGRIRGPTWTATSGRPAPPSPSPTSYISRPGSAPKNRHHGF